MTSDRDMPAELRAIRLIDPRLGLSVDEVIGLAAEGITTLGDLADAVPGVFEDDEPWPSVEAIGEEFRALLEAIERREPAT